MLDKGMNYVPGGTAQDGVKFHHNTQNGTHFKTCELFISGKFPFDIFGLWLNVGNCKSKATNKGREMILYSYFPILWKRWCGTARNSSKLTG